jgi:two-component system phosphate regulon sensor histidine kinase PhoR
MQLNSVSEVVQEVYKTMVSYAEEKQINFTIEFEDNLPKARFDSIKIIQVLTNLVGNSIKFTPKQGKVSVRVQCRDEELVISVSDTGMGIPKEALSRIFERFYCVHRPGKQVQGTGLGLAIVNKIVKMHSGRIEVESEVDHGTTVTVFLPLHIKRLPEVSPEEASSLSE